MGGFLSIGLLMVVLFVVMFVGGLVEFTFESVWEVRSDIDVQKEHAFRVAQRQRGDNRLEGAGAVAERSAWLNRLVIVYESCVSSGSQAASTQYWILRTTSWIDRGSPTPTLPSLPSSLGCLRSRGASSGLRLHLWPPLRSCCWQAGYHLEDFKYLSSAGLPRASC